METSDHHYGGQAEAEEPQRVVIRDKRRIDPVTGAPRTPVTGSTGQPAALDQSGLDAQPGADAAVWQAEPAAGQPAAETEDVRVAELNAALAERTQDLQRVTAEYANYRKRVDRDRSLTAEAAIGGVLLALLPVLDDLDRARDHGDLTGAFKAVADQLTAVLGKLGLVAFGEPGDAFDPAVHEAVSHSTSPEVTVPSCVAILRRGYCHGDRLLRPALVAVADPQPPEPIIPEPTTVGDDAVDQG
jgi:molecular chaperone GrpE